MGYNRSGKRRTDRLKRHRREGRRLASKAGTAASQGGKPASAPKSGGDESARFPV
jgi:hypothetical protein